MAKITIDPKVFNKVYKKYLESEERYQIFYGGSGSGKSVFVGQRALYWHTKEKGHNTIIARKVGDTNRKSTFPLMKQLINDWGFGKIFKINESEMRIKNKFNGNEMVFVGLDNPEKIKSVTFESGIATSVWLEEASEFDAEDLQQLNLRLRGKSKVAKTIWISFNPIHANHWLKAKFFDRTVEDSFICHTTYMDNSFIDDVYKRELESMKETDPYHYQVYCCGIWGVTGRTVFDGQKVSERLAELKQYHLKEKPLRGTFIFEYEDEQIVDDSIKFIPDEKGIITIYEKVEEDKPYVIGGDTSEGGIDFSVGQVLDNTNGKQVAVLIGQMDTDVYAKYMYCLGKYYNTALIAIESNFDLHPIKELQRLKYRKQYQRETIDKISRKVHPKYGFQTNRVTRPVIIDELKIVVRESIELLNDEATLDEMLTFVVNEKGKPEAMEGKHDDLIMALAIAHKAREQQHYTVTPQKERITGTWTTQELLWRGLTKFEIKQMAKTKQINLIK